MPTYKANPSELQRFYTGEVPAETIFPKQDVLRMRSIGDDPDASVRKFANSMMIASKAGVDVNEVFGNYSRFSKSLGYTGESESDFSMFASEFSEQLTIEDQMSLPEHVANRAKSGMLKMREQVATLRKLHNQLIVSPLGKQSVDRAKKLLEDPDKLTEDSRNIADLVVKLGEKREHEISSQNQRLTATISKAEAERLAIPLSRRFKEAMEAEGKEFFVKLLDPRTATEVISGVLAETLPSLPIPIALTGAGALVGGPKGLAAGAGVGAFLQEYPAALLEGMQREGVDFTSTSDLEKAFNNTALLERANSFAVKRSLFIGGGAVLSGGLAGKFKLGKAFLVQEGLDGASEAAAQLATIGKIDPKEVTLEVLAGLPISGVEEAVGRVTRYVPSEAFMRNTTTVDGQPFTKADWKKVRATTPIENLLLGIDNPSERALVMHTYHGNIEAEQLTMQLANNGHKSVFDLLDNHFKRAGKATVDKMKAYFNALPDTEFKRRLVALSTREFHQNDSIRLLHEDLKRTMRLLVRTKNAILFQVKNAATTEADVLAFERSLRGFKEEFDALPEEVRRGFVPIAETIEELGLRNTSEMAALGATIDERNLNQNQLYYPRKIAKRDGTKTYNVAGKFFNGMSPNTLRVNQELKNTTRFQSTSRFRVIDKDGNMLSAHNTHEEAMEAARNTVGAAAILRPATLKQLQAMGLIEDFAKNMDSFFASIQGTRKIGYIDKIYDLIKDRPELFLSNEDFLAQGRINGWVPVSSLKLNIPKTFLTGNKKLRDFTSGHVPKDLGQDLKATYGKNGMLAKGYRFIERNLRAQVTYRNPFRFFKQIPENSLMLFFADSKAWLSHADRIRSSNAFFKWAFSLSDTKKRFALEAEPQFGPFIREFNEAGGLNTDFLTAEGLAEAEKAFREVKDADDIDISNAIIEDKTEGAIHNFTRRVKAIDEILRDAYHIEDVVYKFQYYYYLRKSGVSREESMRRVRDYMFDFENAPRAVKALARVIPFKASVLWQFTRILGNKLRDSPSRTMVKIALAAAAHTAIKEAMDEEMGITEEMRERNERGFAALYPTDIVLPMTDSRGRMLQLSSRWLIPYSDVTTFFPSSFKELREFYRGSMPMTAQPIVTLLTQTDRFGNDLVFSGTKDPDKRAEQTARVWMEALTQAAPGMPVAYLIDQYENQERDDPEDLIYNALLKQTIGVRSVKED